MLIGVAGMVGTGKTTLARALSERFGLQMALESVDADNPWLESFYGGPDEMRAYALQLQLHFLATRFASMRRMRGLGGSWVLDRTWYEDAEIFARGLFEAVTNAGRDPPDYRDRHPIVITDKNRTLDIFVGANAGPLDPRQRQDLRAFVQEFRQHGKGVMMAYVPVGSTDPGPSNPKCVGGGAGGRAGPT